MPVKRRAHKRRISPDAERAMWSGLFECGYDFFNDLSPLGFPGGDCDAAARKAARKAWRRHGAAFMETWRSDVQPWAQVEFGDPCQ